MVRLAKEQRELLEPRHPFCPSLQGLVDVCQQIVCNVQDAWASIWIAGARVSVLCQCLGDGSWFTFSAQKPNAPPRPPPTPPPSPAPPKTLPTKPRNSRERARRRAAQSRPLALRHLCLSANAFRAKVEDSLGSPHQHCRPSGSLCHNL